MAKRIHAPETGRLLGTTLTEGRLDRTPEDQLRKAIRASTSKYERALMRLRKARAKVRACEKDVIAARRDMRLWLDSIGPHQANESKGSSHGL